MRTQYALPGDTQQVVQRFNLAQCRNPGLIFARYAARYALDWRTDATLKKASLETVRDAKPEKELLRALRQRWYTVVTAHQAELFEATTGWRLIVGLGQKGPLEVGFTFHRLYGVPIIPGSALKGLARAYAYLVEERDERDPSFAATFGRAPKPGEDERVARAGEAVFFDAIPWDDPALELDVMNPHYPEYYQDKGLPTNWQSPVPVYFLALKPGLRFAFAVGWRGPLDKEGLNRQRLAVEWLQKGLQELGAGAKTSAGYGYFTGVRALTGPSSTQEPPTTTAQPEAPAPPEQLTWRTGTVQMYRPDLGRGRLVDDRSGQVFSFTREAIEEKGYSPGKKHRVRYAVVEREGRHEVVKVQRL